MTTSVVGTDRSSTLPRPLGRPSLKAADQPTPRMSWGIELDPIRTLLAAAKNADAGSLWMKKRGGKGNRGAQEVGRPVKTVASAGLMLKSRR